MAGFNTTTISSLAALRDGLPELETIHDYLPEQDEGVTFNQRINIIDKEGDDGVSRVLRANGPIIYIRGLAKFIGDRLRLYIALETEGRVEEKTPAQISWKVAFVRENAYEEIEKKTRLFKLPLQHVTAESDECMEIKLRDIKPNFIQEGGFVNLEWQASLVWFYGERIVQPLDKVIVCCHQICDILDTVSDWHQLHEHVEQEVAQADIGGLDFR